jgi:hypothetical protein
LEDERFGKAFRGFGFSITGCSLFGNRRPGRAVSVPTGSSRAHHEISYELRLALVKSFRVKRVGEFEPHIVQVVQKFVAIVGEFAADLRHAGHYSGYERFCIREVRDALT